MAKRSNVYDYDLIAIGSGAGGGVAAHIAASQGYEVAIVEADTIGGECPNYGCVPTKALLTAAERYSVAKDSQEFGIRSAGVSFNFKKVQAWKNLAVKRTGTQAGDRAFAAEGIAVIKGRAHFIDKHTISVKAKRYRAKRFLIATGTHNFVPDIAGLKEAGYLTHRQAINLERLPRSIFIIGGGAIGCEFAHIFNSFGSKVTMAEFAPYLIPREDKEVGQLMKAVFERNGIEVHTSTRVIKVEVSGGKKIVHYRSGHKNGVAHVDEILLAAGMHPNTDLGLENAGVKYTQRGITARDTMQTSMPHIYTAGDVTGPYAFTHTASYQGRVAAHNMFNRQKVVAKYHAVPRVVYTNPEIAAVGMSEEHLKHQKIRYRSNAVAIDIIGRANTTGEMTGFVKVLVSRSGILLGASIVSPSAGEMIHELALAVNLGLKADDVASTIHAFPTWSEAVRIACAGI